MLTHVHQPLMRHNLKSTTLTLIQFQCMMQKLQSNLAKSLRLTNVTGSICLKRKEARQPEKITLRISSSFYRSIEIGQITPKTILTPTSEALRRRKSHVPK